MKIILTPFGSTGDVLPLLSLGRALRGREHEVIVISSPNYKELFAEYDLEFHAAGFDINELMKKKAREIYANPVKLVSSFRNVYRDLLKDQFDTLVYVAADNTDMIIGSGISVACKSAAEFLGTVYYQACYYPFVYHSKYYPPTLTANSKLPSWCNEILWRFQNSILRFLFGNSLNRLRKTHNLEKVTDFTGHLNDNSILACSREMVTIKDDVTEKIFHTGYWYLQDNHELDQETIDFISKKEKTIYIGFGSMTSAAPGKIASIFKELSALSEYNFIISKGWAEFSCDNVNENILYIDFAPFLKLFPLMSVIVHHGGAGTTMHAALSGVPQIIVPHMIDQFFWGDLVADLKIGSRPIRKNKLSVQELKKSIEYIDKHPEIRKNAEETGKRMRKEDGIADTIAFLEEEHAISKGMAN